MLEGAKSCFIVFTLTDAHTASTLQKSGKTAKPQTALSPSLHSSLRQLLLERTRLYFNAMTIRMLKINKNSSFYLIQNCETEHWGFKASVTLQYLCIVLHFRSMPI